QDVVYHPAPLMKEYMAISGGSENSTYRISGLFEKQNGILKHTWFRKGNLHFKGQQKTGRFTFGESISWNETNRRIVPAADIGATGGVVQEIMLDQPVIPVYDSTHLGGFGGAPSYLHNQGGNP